MKKTLWTLGLLIGAALLALTVWGFFGLNRHLIVAIDQCGDAATGIEQTTAALSGKHGTIAMVDEDAGAAKSLIVHADLVARHEQQSLNAWDTNGTVLFNNINGTVTDLRGTVNASTDLVKAATQTAQIMNNGLPVTLAEVNQTLPDVHRAATATANASEQGAKMATSAAKMTDHLEQSIDHPKPTPWYLKWLPASVQTAVSIVLHFL